ncbi:MAG TPA: hypothetical protein VJJ81_03610 [Candidatus Babeliales bacterium]|nr:hypothetical protein [Candidatus Babeliales bacterium]
MHKKTDSSLGLLITTLGIAILVAFCYQFVLHIIGIAVALWIIDYGLKLQGLRGLPFVATQIYDQHFNFKNNRP